MNKQSQAIVNALNSAQQAIQAADPTDWDKEAIQSVYAEIESTFDTFQTQSRAWENRISQEVGDISQDDYYDQNPGDTWRDYFNNVSHIVSFMEASFGYSRNSDWSDPEWGWHGGWASSNCY